MFTKDSIRPQYRMEISWTSIEHHEDYMVLKGAKFAGPALADVKELNSEDAIRIDLTEQAAIVLPYPHIMHLAWRGREYKADGIHLQNCTLKKLSFNEIRELRPSDKIVVDLSNHEEHADARHAHANNFLYRSVLVRSNGEDKLNG